MVNLPIFDLPKVLAFVSSIAYSQDSVVQPCLAAQDVVVHTTVVQLLTGTTEAIIHYKHHSETEICGEMLWYNCRQEQRRQL